MQQYHFEPQGTLPPPLADECLVASRQLRDLLGSCSEMHIWRLNNDDRYKILDFPKPIKINNRNYWRLGNVRRWIAAQEGEPPAAAKLKSKRRDARRPR